MVAIFVLIAAAPTATHALSLSPLDSDGDGLSDAEEARYQTDPRMRDTDGDGYDDGTEVAHGYSPLEAGGVQMHQHDLDGDGLNDWLELWFGSDMNSIDTDGDGFSDRIEVMAGYDPIDNAPVQKYDRKIVVDKTKQRLYYMVDGIKIENYPVSTGNPGTETPNGTFSIMRKVQLKDYRGADYFVPDVWWNMEFLPTYYIHGAYWHNDFGQRTHSHGCVNMTNMDAADLYRFVSDGMPVEVIGETPPRYRVE